MKYILEYNKYNNSGRGVSLSEIDFIKLLKKNCTDWLKNPHPLVRYKDEEGDYYELIEPKSHNRHSKNMDNYNTMLMDNLPSWSRFPKRSESVIFFNGVNYTDNFGDYLHFVIPFDNAKFGVSPSDDLFTSYNNKVDFTLEFNDRLSRGFFNIDAPINYKDFVKYMNEEFIKPDFFDNKYAYTEFLKIRKYSIESKYETTMDYLNNLLAPENFESEYIHDGFKLMDYNNMVKVKNGNRFVETWTDSNCLIVSMGLSPDKTSNIQDSFNYLYSKLNV